MVRLRWLLALAVFLGCVRALPESELEARCEEGLAQYCLDLGLARLDQGDVARAVRWLDRGCGSGDPLACGQLRALHGTAWASVPALGRSLTRVEPACSRGDATACELARELQGRLEVLQDQEARAHATLVQALPKAPSKAECDGGQAGGLKKDEIKPVIARHSVDVRACYEEWMWRGKDAAIDVTVTWQIGPGGQVTSATITRDTLPASGVARCVHRAVLSWRFPPPRCGGRVDVTFPWLLRVGE